MERALAHAGTATPAFVLSSGRCGSTLLSRMLAHHPELLSISEFWSTQGGTQLLGLSELDGADFWQALSRPDPDLSALLACTDVPEVVARANRAQLPALAPLLLVTLPALSQEPEALFARLGAFARELPRSGAGAHVSELFRFLCEQLGRRHWIERSGGSIEYADALARTWPQARRIFLLRDGRECALSMARHPLFRLRVARLVHGLQQPVELCLRSAIPLDRFGAYWSALMARTARLLSAAKDGTLVVSHAQLVAEPRRTLERVASFLELPEAGEAWIDRAAALVERRPPAIAELAPEERARLERACRPGMRLFERLCSAS